jgi:hypothetical protein
MCPARQAFAPRRVCPARCGRRTAARGNVLDRRIAPHVRAGRPLKILRGPGVPPNHWRLVDSKLGRLHVATNGKPSARPPLVRGITNFRVCPESMCRNCRQSFPWFRGPSWISRISASSTTGSVALLVRHHELLPMLTLSTTSEHSHISASTMTPALPSSTRECERQRSRPLRGLSDAYAHRKAAQMAARVSNA